MKKIYSESIIFGVLFILTIVLIFTFKSNTVVVNNTVQIIDNCEYIKTYYGRGWYLIHKENCTNSIHYKK